MAQSYETDILLKIDIAQAKKDLQAINDQIKTLNATTDDTEEQVKALEKQWDMLNSTIEKAEKIQKPLGAQLKEITKQLQQMKYAGQENTAEYQNLMKEAGKLKDAIGDVGTEINKTASDTANLDAVLGAMSAVSGGFGAATAVMSMFGAESDKVEKAQKRLMQAIALVNSIQQISTALNKSGAFMAGLHRVAQSLLSKQMQATAVATNAASKSMATFKAQLISTGVGALVVALGSLVAVMVDFGDEAEEAAEKNDKFNESITKTEEQLNKNLSLQQQLLKLNYDELTVQDKLRQKQRELAIAQKERADIANRAFETGAQRAEAEMKADIKIKEINKEIKKLKKEIADANAAEEAAAKKRKEDYANAIAKAKEYLQVLRDLNSQSQDNYESAKIQFLELEAERLELETDTSTEEGKKTVYDAQIKLSQAKYDEEKRLAEKADAEEKARNEKAYNDALEAAKKTGIVSAEIKQQFDEAEKKRKETHEQVMKNIDKKYSNERLSIWKKFYEEQSEESSLTWQNYVAMAQTAANSVGSIFDAIGDMQDENSKEGFETQKKMQIASATTTGLAGAAGAFATTFGQFGAPYGAILGAAAAAAVLATTAANIAKIKKQKYNAPQEGGGEAQTGTAVGTGTSSVSQAIISRNISSLATEEKSKVQTVLVVDDVTSKQMQQNQIQKVSTI